MLDLTKILIAGGHGMIGSHLDFGIKPLKSELDVTNSKSIYESCEKYNPSGILSLCNINIRSSEQNPLEAYKINALGVYNLAKEAKKRKVPLILVSTGVVFNGSIDDFFSEESVPNPVNIYRQAKYLAEIIVLESSDKNLIIRTGWVFGNTNSPEKKGIFDKMLDSVIEGKEITATYDQIGSPIYLEDLKDELKKLIYDHRCGIYHLVNSNKASAVDFVEKALRYLKYNSKINKASVTEFASTLKRSSSEYLISEKIKLRSLQESLGDYL